jgi:hypothetical protein
MHPREGAEGVLHGSGRRQRQRTCRKQTQGRGCPQRRQSHAAAYPAGRRSVRAVRVQQLSQIAARLRLCADSHRPLHREGAAVPRLRLPGDAVRPQRVPCGIVRLGQKDALPLLRLRHGSVQWLRLACRRRRSAAAAASMRLRSSSSGVAHRRRSVASASDVVRRFSAAAASSSAASAAATMRFSCCRFDASLQFGCVRLQHGVAQRLQLLDGRCSAASAS